MTDEQPADVPVMIAATIDCNDLETMTAFWGALLGVDTQIHDHFGFLAHSPAHGGVRMADTRTRNSFRS